MSQKKENANTGERSGLRVERGTYVFDVEYRGGEHGTITLDSTAGVNVFQRSCRKQFRCSRETRGSVRLQRTGPPSRTWAPRSFGSVGASRVSRGRRERKQRCKTERGLQGGWSECEDGSEKPDDGEEEGRKPQKVQNPLKPSEAEVEEHNLTHLPCRRCRHCVRGRGKRCPTANWMMRPACGGPFEPHGGGKRRQDGLRALQVSEGSDVEHRVRRRRPLETEAHRGSGGKVQLHVGRWRVPWLARSVWRTHGVRRDRSLEDAHGATKSSPGSMAPSERGERFEVTKMTNCEAEREKVEAEQKAPVRFMIRHEDLEKHGEQLAKAIRNNVEPGSQMP